MTGIQRGKGEMRAASGSWVSEFLLPLLAVLAPQANREDTRQTISGSRVHILFMLGTHFKPAGFHMITMMTVITVQKVQR